MVKKKKKSYKKINSEVFLKTQNTVTGHTPYTLVGGSPITGPPGFALCTCEQWYALPFSTKGRALHTVPPRAYCPGPPFIAT